MSTKFYQKNNNNAHTLQGPNGQPIRFEKLHDSVGVLKLDSNDPVSAFLDAIIVTRLGGVSAIDEATYDELKKKLDLSISRPDRRRPTVVRAVEDGSSRNKAASQGSAETAAGQASAGVAVADGLVPPVAAPEPSTKLPTLGKRAYNRKGRLSADGAVVSVTPAPDESPPVAPE